MSNDELKKKMIKNLFVRFLKEKGIYKLFVNNFYHEKETSPYFTKRRDISFYLENKQSFFYVSGAFEWEDTEEGHNFWWAISDEWSIVRREILDMVE